MDKLKVCLLTDTATLPTRKHPNDAGIDLYADFYYTNPRGDDLYRDSHLTAEIPKNSVVIVGTGVCVEIPDGFFGWITNKSGSDFLVGGGIVDSGYRGELLIKIFNPLSTPMTIKHGQKIAQLLIIPCMIMQPVSVSEKEIYSETTTRGKDGGIARQADDYDEDPFHYEDFPEDSDYLEWRSTQGDYDDDSWDEEDEYDYMLDDFNYDAYRD